MKKKNDRALLCKILLCLEELLVNAPEDDELEDRGEYDLAEMFAEAQNLKEAIENLGYTPIDPEGDILNAFLNNACEVDGTHETAEILKSLGASDELLLDMGFDADFDEELESHGYAGVDDNSSDDEEKAADAAKEAEETPDLSEEELKALYNSSVNHCCKCGCRLEDANGRLGSVFVLDKKGNFYCMNCDGDFEDVDDRIYDDPDEFFLATFSVEARYEARIYAEDVDEARKKANEAFSDADFGEAKDIDGVLVKIEDEFGDEVYRKPEYEEEGNFNA